METCNETYVFEHTPGDGAPTGGKSSELNTGGVFSCVRETFLFFFSALWLFLLPDLLLVRGEGELESPGLAPLGLSKKSAKLCLLLWPCWRGWSDGELWLLLDRPDCRVSPELLDRLLCFRGTLPWPPLLQSPELLGCVSQGLALWWPEPPLGVCSLQSPVFDPNSCTLFVFCPCAEPCTGFFFTFSKLDGVLAGVVVVERHPWIKCSVWSRKKFNRNGMKSSFTSNSCKWFKAAFWTLWKKHQIRSSFHFKRKYIWKLYRLMQRIGSALMNSILTDFLSLRNISFDIHGDSW